ncbi:hypothetical protein HOY82DRAFT_603331 [Tuber indicum]|nr:hypothetical protein HOY82DRAFT_603331 [Tuber indicum]
MAKNLCRNLGGARRDNRWGASPPETGLDYLRDPYNLPEDRIGEWIFNDSGYKKWQSSDQAELLWLCGGPGTGKTMLAKHGVPPDGAESSQHRLAKVLWDLLHGILQQNGNLFEGCKAEIEYQGNMLLTNPVSLWKVLRKSIKDCEPGPIYILIGAVDGFKESLCEELIESILRLIDIPGRKVKIFLSSRDLPHILINLCEHTKINLDTNGFVKTDLKTFMKRKVDKFGGWDVGQKDGATDAIFVRSEGIFLWALLAIKNLKFFSAGPDYEDILETLPLGLKDVYRKMLCDIDSREGPEKALEMIRNVALALRPLTFG